MDWRMDKSSWGMIVFMIATMVFFIASGAGFELNTVGYLQALGYGLLTVLALIALACIPVLIYCYFVKMIPDIDYSVRAAFAVTLVGLITDVIF
ncbi:MAG: hypothetical protein IPL23_05545 [Saprospiraceae bacterium]|nr:hypothetical protein [Saprospiraceae bacterium]MBK8636236.1 hypothetical protein [Saprospiraceae bacterium]HMS66729.1 hypothetical protein [Saprospiraceae bacterium]